jgi:hypothetical protein
LAVQVVGDAAGAAADVEDRAVAGGADQRLARRRPGSGDRVRGQAQAGQALVDAAYGIAQAPLAARVGGGVG